MNIGGSSKRPLPGLIRLMVVAATLAVLGIGTLVWNAARGESFLAASGFVTGALLILAGAWLTHRRRRV